MSSSERPATDALQELASVLSGRYSLDLPGGVHLRSRMLPWGIPAVAMPIEGELFLYWDPGQPLGQQQALELVRGHAPELLGYLGEIGELLTPPAGGRCALMPASDAPSEAASIG